MGRRAQSPSSPKAAAASQERSPGRLGRALGSSVGRSPRHRSGGAAAAAQQRQRSSSGSAAAAAAVAYAQGLLSGDEGDEGSDEGESAMRNRRRHRRRVVRSRRRARSTPHSTWCSSWRSRRPARRVEREQVLAVWASSGACWATRLSPSSRSTRPPSLSRTRPRSPFSIAADEGTCGTRLSGSSVRPKDCTCCRLAPRQLLLQRSARHRQS